MKKIMFIIMLIGYVFPSTNQSSIKLTNDQTFTTTQSGYFMSKDIITYYINVDRMYMSMTNNYSNMSLANNKYKELVNVLQTHNTNLEIQHGRLKLIFDYQQQEIEILDKLNKKWQRNKKFETFFRVSSFISGMITVGGSIYLSQYLYK